jgi:hypothetical protein
MFLVFLTGEDIFLTDLDEGFIIFWVCIFVWSPNFVSEVIGGYNVLFSIKLVFVNLSCKYLIFGMLFTRHKICIHFLSKFGEHTTPF